MEVKLEFGSGREGSPGYIHIDIVKFKEVDKRLDVSKKLPFEDNFTDEILAKHLIEHIGYWKFPEVFKDWYRIVKLGGKLTIITPDFKWMAKSYVEKQGKEAILWYDTEKNFNLNFMLYGDKRGRALSHKGIFDFDYLKLLLEMVGFKNIIRLEIEGEPWNIHCEAIK